jgi:hypothetical protein
VFDWYAPGITVGMVGRSGSGALFFRLIIAAVIAGCSASEGDDAASAGTQNLTGASDTSAADVARAYYAATQTADPTAHLEPIVADDAVLAAPSVMLLTGKPEIQGKAAFIKGVAGNAAILGKASVREVIPRGDDLVVTRINLPLPNGDTITQVEFFTLENGKIKRLDSYYDSLRFSAAIPAILLDRLKEAFH